MIHSGNARCFLIGEDHLLIKCAEILIHHQFTIVGLISAFPKAQKWSKNHHIPVFSTLDEAKILFVQKKIDYLFSIVNRVIIPERFIALTQKLAINYHHSPLPKYAGLNTISWSLLNNEPVHGVTWHLLNKMIDGGDILKQSLFNIDKHETGLSLNQKCYQQALALFSELIFEIKNQTYTQQKQNIALRTYYDLCKKPNNNGLIDLNQSSEEIERSFRAFNLGAYDNTLSTVKLMIHNECYIVSELKTSEHSSRIKPGIIIEINSSFLKVSTQTKDIFLIKILSIFGKEITLIDWVKKHNLQEGCQLINLEKSEINAFHKISEKLMKNEAFWIKKLINFEPSEMPFNGQFSIKSNTKYKLLKTLKLSHGWLSKLDAINPSNINKSSIVLTLWLIYLYRIGNKKNLGVSLQYTQFINQKIGNLFASELPFPINFDEKITFKSACHLISKNVLIFEENHTFLKDIFYRYPFLANTSPSIPITIWMDEDDIFDSKHFHSNASLLLRISIKKQCIEWYVENQIIRNKPNILKCMENSAAHLQVLMHAAIDNPVCPITELPLLPPNEREMILGDWNNTAYHYPKNKTAIEIIEQQAQLYSQNIAFEFEDSVLTYGALFQQVNQLAQLFLIKYGIKPQQNVGVYLPRNSIWLISTLAIMKIGAVYVPIAHNTPINRVKLITKDSKAVFMLSNEVLLEHFPQKEINACTIINIEHALQTRPFLYPTHPYPAIDASAIAYIMYTSGTTGVFKGVMIKHSSLVNLIHFQVIALQLDAHTRVLQFASIAFDASIWEIFATLMAGATLCIPTDRHVLIGKNLSKVIQKFQISLITLPPSILQTISPKETPSLKTVVTAGESCPKDLAYLWIKSVHLINAYGPTETTVCATLNIMQKNAPITIGKPIANTKAYILDERLNPVPIGVAGELYIGGEAVAKGYFNQPTLTEHFFISNPVSLHQKDIIYKTRDLARWLPNGEIEYLGRVDHQIKIRGLQIEPEAIETQILHHPHVAQTVVCMQDDEKLHKYIVAYLVPHQKIDLHQLRTYLSEHLPHYMIPSFFVILEQLPLTMNGKIDRKSLPKPKLSHLPTNDNEAPSTDIEKKLCQIWKNLLGNERIGIHQDFFTIGGNSLLLSQLMMALRDHFNFEMHFSLILKNPTIASLAQLVSKKFNPFIEESDHKQLLKDAFLPQEIKPSHRKKKRTHSILLTGATGFVGAHLLKNLHKQKHLNIYCLTRANSDHEALERLKKSITHFGLDFSFDERIIPIAGDISHTKLGLSENIFKHLTKEIDDIYHNAAFVHHLYDYERLRTTNVNSTRELLKLASQHKAKQIHFISTLSALNHFTNQNGKIIEKFLTLDAHHPPKDGYNQTKWVSEKLLATAALRGFPINIYRPSLLLGNTFHGKESFHNNHLLSLIKSCVQMKFAPLWDIELDILPVEFFSDIIVKIATSEKFKNQVFNFSNQHKIRWLAIVEFLNDFGFPIQIIPAKQWMELVSQKHQNVAIFNLLPLYAKEKGSSDMHLKTKPSEYTNAKAALNFFNEQYPMINQEVLTHFLYFLNIGLTKNI